MNTIIKSITLPAIIGSGETYILVAEKESGWEIRSIDEIYVLTRDKDILAALEMELGLHRDGFELLAFIKWAEVLDDCYEFRFLCYDTAAKEEVRCSFFLYRIATFYERLAAARVRVIDYN